VIDVLLLYRGRYREQVEALAARLRDRGLKVTYDREILDGPDKPVASASDADASAREVHWFSLGDASVDNDVAWRGPLSDAVSRAGLSVFLYDARDQSVNVMNEISWVARAGRNVFFAIDTGSADTSLDYECIVLGMLQSWFGISRGTLDPTIPDFGYEFIAHAAPDAMQRRLDVLLHRILSYRERIASAGLRTISLANDLTLDQARNAPLERARRRLREIQASFAAAPSAQGKSPVEAKDRFHEILDLQLQREQGAQVVDGKLHAPGALYAYAEGPERARYERTEEIIQRSRPGPHEAVPIFPSLARQAATVELWIAASRTTPQQKQAGFHPAIVLGTVPFAQRRSVPMLSEEHDNAVLLLNLGFVDFCYQLVKLSVLAWKLTSGENVSPASFQSREAAIKEVLDARPALVDSLAELLRSYAETGLAHALEPMPTLPYQLPLTLLVAFAERFTIAHGYAQLGMFDPTGTRPAAGLTAQADVQACVVVLGSAMLQDHVDPMIALQGCLFAVNADQLVALQLARRADAPADAARAAEELRQKRCGALTATYVELATGRGMSDDDAQHTATVAREGADAAMQMWRRIR
jgi:hypothetical protein